MKKNNKTETPNKLIVGNMAWADTIPKWLLAEVEMERTANQSLPNEFKTALDKGLTESFNCQRVFTMILGGEK